MIGWHVFVKTLKESVRRPLYIATLLGIPLALMIIFGAALPAAEPGDPDAESGQALAAAPGGLSVPGATSPGRDDQSNAPEEYVITRVTPVRQTITTMPDDPPDDASGSEESGAETGRWSWWDRDRQEDETPWWRR